MTPKKHSLHHIAVMVEDLEIALEFYRKLGFQDLKTPQPVLDKRIHWLEATDNCALHVIEVPPSENVERTHFALTVENIDEWRNFASAQGLFIREQSIALDGINRFFIADPSDNLVEFIEMEVESEEVAV